MSAGNRAPILTDPPDPNPKKPKLALPPGSWDCLIHVYGPIDKYPFDPRNPYTCGECLPETYIRQAHAPERLLWASNWPHPMMNGKEMANDGDLVDLIADWIPDAATRRRVMVDNPEQLYAGK